MAVSLSEAWNDIIITPPVAKDYHQVDQRLPTQDVKQPGVHDMLAAKHTKIELR